jgi:hypothetical protein
LVALVLACAVALATPTRSASVEVEPGPVFHFRTSVAPHAVSASTPTPVTLTFAASTRQGDGSAASGIRKLSLDLDRKMSIDFAGRETCSDWPGVIPPAGCRRAIVGRGRLAGTVVFPGLEPFPFDIPTTVYNDGVERGGAALYIYARFPTPVTYLTLILPLSLHRRVDGPFGYRATLSLWRYANSTWALSDLSATIGLPRRGNLGGTLTMQCSNGKPVRIRARAALADDTQLEAQSRRPCSSAD